MCRIRQVIAPVEGVHRPGFFPGATGAKWRPGSIAHELNAELDHTRKQKNRRS